MPISDQLRAALVHWHLTRNVVFCVQDETIEYAMNITVSRIMIIGLLLLSTLVSGVWLSSRGRPYNSALFNIHKLIALGAVIVTAATVYQLRANGDIRTLTGGAIVITGMLFLALFVSGASLSIGRPDHAAILMVHRAAPLLAVIFTVLSLYLLANGQSIGRGLRACGSIPQYASDGRSRGRPPGR
jgi:hypothetical protein